MKIDKAVPLKSADSPPISDFRVPTSYDVLIIGAGMSGLAAGIRLAHFGKRVCILERHTTIGGLNSFYRLAGRNHDVGLHAVTNFTPKGTKTGPLARLLRQLRFSWDEFELRPQLGSRIAFPGVNLRFDNDSRLLLSQIADHFPTQIDGLRRLIAELPDYDQLGSGGPPGSARGYLSKYLSEPLLCEMLMCPLMYYGNAREQDMDVAQFCIMFRSIFLEGFARPFAGVRLILKKLVRRYKELGGELRLNSGVRQLAVEGDRIAGVVLDNGEELSARQVLSSAGHVETLRLCSSPSKKTPSVLSPPAPGILSFVETVSVLDRQPCELDHHETIVFFNDSPAFDWRRPEALVDPRSGVICSPNNFAYDEPLHEGIVRVTALANFDRWQELSPDDYSREKERWYREVQASAIRFVPDFRPHVVATDMFTPITIRRFTGHDHGAVYGAPEKRYDGTTSFDNLFLCGTDQGFVGIVGAIVSGIAMANAHCLKNQLQ